MSTPVGNMLVRSGDKEEEFYFLHYKVPCCLTFFCISMDFFYNLKFIRGIMRRKKLKKERMRKKEFLLLSFGSSLFFKACFETFFPKWGLNRTLNSRAILLIVYTMYVQFRKVFLEILDLEILGFSKNVYQGNIC